MEDKSLKRLTLSALAGAAFICTGALNASHVDAATNTSSMNGVLVTKYNGKGKIRLLDQNGKYQNQYVPKNAAYKVFEQGTINNQKMYRLGTQKQWIPAKFTNLSSTNEGKVSNSSSTNNNVLTIKYVPNYGIAVWDSPNANQHIVKGKYLKHNSSWKFFKEAVGKDGYIWYNLGGNQWISSKYTNIPKVYGNSSNNSQSNTASSNHSAGQTTKPSTNNKPTNTPSKPTTNNNKPTNNGNGTWSQADIVEAQNAFISYVNNWRQSQGLKPFENNVSWLQQGAETRVNDNAQMFEQNGEISHYRANGKDWSDAFNVTSGELGGENIGYVGSSTGYTPKQAAESIAQGFINEGPNGGHYAVLHASYGSHPAIGVAFKQVYRNGEYVYIMNMETGTNARIAKVGSRIQGDADHDETWAAQWKGMMAPSLKEYTYIQGGRVHVEQSKFPTETGYDYKYTSLNYLPEDQLAAYENAYVQYMKEKYNAIIE